MESKADMMARLDFHKSSRDAARTAYLALLNGQVQMYTIGSRSLTKFDLVKLREEIDYHEKEIAALTAMLSGQRRRRAVAVVPRDW